MYFQRYRSIDQSVRDRADFVQTKELLQQVRSDLNQIYQDKFQDGTVKVLLAEIKQFARTIHHGEQILSEMLTQLDTNQLPGRNVFKLYDTYGFPVELTQELAAEHHIEVDMS
jgi:alanyl-tRNA synthetase